jgi:hypothetical protein
MTEEDIKEELSRNFVQLVASRRGFIHKIGNKDYGTDLQVCEVQSVQVAGGVGRRYYETGKALDLQLKCTCDVSATRRRDGVHYALHVKNYNDLVRRWATEPSTPLYLLLMVLPNNPDEWMEISPTELILRRYVYWFRPPLGAAESQNANSVTITIPIANVVDLDFFPSRIAEHWA